MTDKEFFEHLRAWKHGSQRQPKPFWAAPMPPSAPMAGDAWQSAAGRDVRPIPSVRPPAKDGRTVERWEPSGPGEVDDQGQVHREGYHGPH